MNTYARLPVAFVSGAGARLTDEAVRTTWTPSRALRSAAWATPILSSPMRLRSKPAPSSTPPIFTESPLQEQLADRLCALTGMKQVFFGNSGAEANEAAIKLAQLYGHRKGVAIAIIVMEGAFHGRTMATLTATGNRKVQAGFEPCPGLRSRPLRRFGSGGKHCGTPKQRGGGFCGAHSGEGGIVVPPADYLPGLRALCDAKGWLLMLDEVQSGAGRTGRLFAHEHAGILPDVLTTAKGIANGFPIGAALTGGAAHEVLGPGTHGSTFEAIPCQPAAAPRHPSPCLLMGTPYPGSPPSVTACKAVSSKPLRGITG